MVDVYVAVGGNIEPEKYVPRALQALEQAFGCLTVSPAYRNQAVGFDGADFVNLAVGFDTVESVRSVKERLEQIEALCDRPRTAPRWAPRTMDLDILLYGAAVSEEPDLRLPRPDLLRRAYMLKPLADIAPGLAHPTQHRTIRELWAAFEQGHALIPVTIPRCDRRPPPGSGP